MFYRIEGKYSESFEGFGLFCLKNKWDIYLPVICGILKITKEPIQEYDVCEIEGDIVKIMTGFPANFGDESKQVSEIIRINCVFLRETSRKLIGQVIINMEDENQIEYEYIEMM